MCPRSAALPLPAAAAALWPAVAPTSCSRCAGAGAAPCAVDPSPCSWQAAVVVVVVVAVAAQPTPMASKHLSHACPLTMLCCAAWLATQVWDTKGLSLDAETPAKLRVTAAVAAHDKDINAVAVAPNDSGVCAGVGAWVCGWVGLPIALAVWAAGCLPAVILLFPPLACTCCPASSAQPLRTVAVPPRPAPPRPTPPHPPLSCSHLLRQSGPYCQGVEASQPGALPDPQGPQARHLGGCLLPRRPGSGHSIRWVDGVCELSGLPFPEVRGPPCAASPAAAMWDLAGSWLGRLGRRNVPTEAHAHLSR